MSDGPYSNERSGASVKTVRENGERHGREARTLDTRASITALRAFRKCPKTTVLQSTIYHAISIISMALKMAEAD